MSFRHGVRIIIKNIFEFCYLDKVYENEKY